MNVRVASLALACFVLPAAAFAQPPSRSCVRVEVSSDAPSAPSSRSAAGTNVLAPASPAFSATGILDLTFTVLFPRALEGEHLVELRVFTPDAQLYRSMAVPVARSSPPGASRQVEGYARPLPQQALKQVRRGRGVFAAASTTFPVGGTDIVSAGLYGRWRVEAYLDGAQQRCGPAASFVLNP